MPDEDIDKSASTVEPAKTEDTAKPDATPPVAAAPDPEIAAMRAENAQLRAATEKAQQDAAAATGYVQQLTQHIQNAAANGQRPSADDIREKFVENPVGVVDALFQERMAPLYGNYLNNQAQLNRQLAAERLKGDNWSKYEKEVDEFMKTIPAEVQAQPGSYEQAFRFVQAKHLDEIIEERATQRLAKERNAFVEGGSAAAANGQQTPKLSPEERSVAEGLGLTVEDYVKWRDVGPSAGV